MGETSQEIYKRMASDLKDPASKIEGSFTADNLQAVANELARIRSEDYDRLLDRSHIATAEGEDLDIAAKENHGMTRLVASYEEVNLLFTGTEGTVVDESIVAKADDIEFHVSGSYMIKEDGTVMASAKCSKAGSGYHVLANTVNTFVGSHDGLTEVTNPEESSGGYDRETDAVFRQRIQDKEKDMPGYGNVAWYRSAAKEVNGVEKAKVFDVPRGNGTVDVVIIAKGNTEASKVLVQRVYEHIEEERIAGANVSVMAGTALAVSIAADVWLTDGYALSSIQNEFKEKMADYLETIEFESSKVNSRVSYAKVSELLMGCAGVQDIEQLTLNHAGTSIALAPRSFPVLAEVEFRLGG